MLPRLLQRCYLKVAHTIAYAYGLNLAINKLLADSVSIPINSMTGNSNRFNCSSARKIQKTIFTLKNPNRIFKSDSIPKRS